MKPICVIGDGAWGTAVSTVLAYNGFNVKLWCYNSDVAEEIKNNRTNKYLSGVKLDEKIIPFTEIESCGDCEWFFEAVPVPYLRSVLEKFKLIYSEDKKWVVLSKGIEKDSLLFPYQIMDDVFKSDVKKVILAGPSFALEVADKELTSVEIASKNKDLSDELHKILNNDFFKTYPSDDIVGLQICSASKNVMALGMGLLNGLGYANNTKAFFLTRALREIGKLVIDFGGNKDTAYGLSGMGDLFLTATSSLSRNFRVGVMLGEGKKLQDILNNVNFKPESINTVIALSQIIEKRKIHLPLVKAIYNIIYEGNDPKLLSNVLTEVE